MRLWPANPVKFPKTREGRIGTPEEIASAVLWLSSPGAMFITGQDIIVDGGYTAQ